MHNGSEAKLRQRVAVLHGGSSAEREISLRSGECVARALEAGGHHAERIDTAVSPVTSIDWSNFDLAFIALHGTGGEDGAIQQELDQLGVRYTGSGAAASALAFDKLKAKSIFASKRLPTPRWRAVPPSASLRVLRPLANELGFPLVVKPVAQGSSLGVSIVQVEDEFEPAVQMARSLGGEIFFEAAVPGEEWTVPLLDEMILPPIRIHTAHSFFDFTAKYEADDTRYEVRNIDADETARQVGQLALQAALALGCRGNTRVDLRVDRLGNPWLLEVNTIPGMTDHSLVPKSAAGLGWSMTELCERIMASVPAVADSGIGAVAVGRARPVSHDRAA